MPPALAAHLRDYIPLLALLGATAAYVSAIRLWIHKVRTDALDALLKAQRSEGKEAIPEHLKERMSRAVVWLWALAVTDLTVVFGAGLVFRLAFYDQMPSRNWFTANEFDPLYCAIQIMWLGFVFLAASHVTSALRAFGLRLNYDPAQANAAHAERWYARPIVLLRAIAVFVAVLFVFLGL